MKPAARISVVAVLLLCGSAGVLYPLHGSLSELEAQVELLEADLARNAGVHEELMRAGAQRREVQERLSQRAFKLCPNTPEAEHDVEADLQNRVEDAGLQSLRVDRRNDSVDGANPCLVFDLVVDGDGPALHRFLLALEELSWVTRVTSLSIEPGEGVRRINIQVAVVLERKS
ncbi:MAG TPA: hypothetical protein VFD43_06435 [Planctomycetota bacterium]|nr:hypothetical protein [Planctomycetota bacterium]